MTSLAKSFQIQWRSNIFAFLLCLILAAGWLAVLTFKYVHFGYYDWDLALFAQTMWSLAHGSLEPSLYGTNFLANHAENFSFLLTPIYAVFPHPITLLVLKILAFTGGAFIFYLIAKDIVGKGAAVVLMLLYLFYPVNLYMMIFEFNFENLAIFFIFLTYYFFRKEKFIGFTVSCLLGALIKENVALLMASFFIPALFSTRKNKLAWIFMPMIIGCGIFYVSMFMITPHLRTLADLSSANQYIGYYVPDFKAKGLFSIETLKHYIQALTVNLHDPKNFLFLRDLLLPLNALPFFSPQILLINTPVFLQCLLSSSPTMKMIYFHYSATLMPAVFLATAVTLGWIKTFCRPRIFRIIMSLLIMACLMTTLDLRTNPTFLARLKWQDRLDPVRREIVRRIPPNTPVIATFEFLPELSRRKSLYTFYKIWLDAGVFTGRKPYPLPEKVAYAVFDWQDPWFWNQVLAAPDPDAARTYVRRIQHFFLTDDWRASYAVEDLVLFDKNVPKGKKLVDINSGSPEPIPRFKAIDIAKKFQLTGFTGLPPKTRPGDVIGLNFYWRTSTNIDTIYQIRLALKKGQVEAFTWDHIIGYGIAPTILWKADDQIREFYRIMLPDLAPGRYTLHVEFINARSSHIVEGRQAGQTAFSFSLGEIAIREER